MKKHLAILMLTVLCLNAICVSYADDGFTLRNGIVFEDTMETILEKEKSLTRTGETSKTFKGKIAGYNNAECSFDFDDDNKLISMNYDFMNSCTSRDTTNDVYKKLYQSLVRQYGKPLGNTGGTTHAIQGPAITAMALWVYLLGAMEKNAGDYYDYDEWTIDAGDYHVKIDLVSYYYRDSNYDYKYFVNLSYTKYTDEDVMAVIEENRKEQNEVDDDL